MGARQREGPRKGLTCRERGLAGGVAGRKLGPWMIFDGWRGLIEPLGNLHATTTRAWERRMRALELRRQLVEPLATMLGRLERVRARRASVLAGVGGEGPARPGRLAP